MVLPVYFFKVSTILQQAKYIFYFFWEDSEIVQRNQSMIFLNPDKH